MTDSVVLGWVMWRRSAAAWACFSSAEVAEVTLETGLVLPSLVVPVGFGEVRVSVGAVGEVAPAAPVA
jgi:hypothetical protein